MIKFRRNSSRGICIRIETLIINSVRLPVKNVLRFVKEYDVDVMSLQKSKTENKYFPLTKFIDAIMNYYNFKGVEFEKFRNFI